MDRYPDDIPLRSCYGTVLVRQEEYEHAAHIFESLRECPELPPEYDAVILNNLAWIDVASWKVKDFQRAQDFSHRAMDALPWNSAVKGTRGSVLVASGDVAIGINLLKEAWVENEDIQNQALNAAFLALGYARLKELQDARHWFNTAQRLDPHCSQLKRVRQEIDDLAAAAASPSP